ncbi:TMEM165/GDT1 family protein [Chlorogloeopsis sp. ULAP02]|uniref:TMEM165/GDT1 family protein n=1 Tax=Chlorogloeopsis sp. ULAP02 TaxID=3107926 RepID=UPI003134C359
MKLDSVPVTIASVSQPPTQLELKSISPSPTTVDCPQKQSVVAIFTTTFVTIFLAEIGDKTQLSTLLMSAESNSPWVVFVGSAAALITTSLLGVILGSWIASRLSPKTINKAAGVMLLLISLMLFWDVVIN